jgi:hypothetical protein
MPEDKARKRAVRARMAATGERYTTAARRLSEGLAAAPLTIPPGYTCPDCGGADLAAERTGAESVRVTCGACGEASVRPAVAFEIPPAPNDPAYTDLVKDDPELAERDWWTRARVRILSTYPGGTPDIWHNRERPPQPGEELPMLQDGRPGRPVHRDTWWTSTDIDGAAAVPAEHVLVLEVLEASAPTHKGAALPARQVTAILGPGAGPWAALGVLVIAGTFSFEIRAADGELVGLVDRATGERYRHQQAREPVTYRVVIGEHAEAWPSPPSVPFPPGFLPPDPVRTAAAERALRNGAGDRPAAASASGNDGFGGHEFEHEQATDLFRCTECGVYEVTARDTDGPIRPCAGLAGYGGDTERVYLLLTENPALPDSHVAALATSIRSTGIGRAPRFPWRDGRLLVESAPSVVADLARRIELITFTVDGQQVPAVSSVDHLTAQAGQIIIAENHAAYVAEYGEPA